MPGAASPALAPGVTHLSGGWGALLDLEPSPALSVNISLCHPGSPQTKGICVRRRESHSATAGDSSFNPGTHAERMTLLIPGLSAGNSGHQTRGPVSARVHATCCPRLPAGFPASSSSAERGRGSCLCHRPTLTHCGSRTEKGAWGSVNSSFWAPHWLQEKQGLPQAPDLLGIPALYYH